MIAFYLMKRGKAFVAIFLLIYLLGLSLVSAFGVSTVYSENYPLTMKPGESKETFFLMRNIVEGDSDVVISSDLVKGKEIAKLLDEGKKYDVPYGAEVEVPVRIEIPKDAKPGARYTVGVIFKPSPKEGGQGNIQFIVNIGKSFPVVVAGEDKKEDFSLTVEDDEGLVQAFAPFVEQHKGLFFTILFLFLISIIILVVLIVVISAKSKRLREAEVTGQFAQNR